MEEFEGIGSIVEEFNIKGSTLNLFNIKWKTPSSDQELKRFVQIPYGPHDKAFPGLPLVVNSSGKLLRYMAQDKMMDKSILEYDESKFESDFELNESSISTNLTQFMNEYNINDDLRQGCGYHDSQAFPTDNHKQQILSDIILESNCEDSESVEKNSILSSDFAQLSSNRWENGSSNKAKLSSEREDLVSLKSEPFADLELDDFVGLRD